MRQPPRDCRQKSESARAQSVSVGHTIDSGETSRNALRTSRAFRENRHKAIVHLDFQSSAAAWKHADLLAYNALLFAHHRVAVHTVIVLLRPEAAHRNMDGLVHYALRPGRGSMDFRYEVVRLWERPADDLLAAELGVAPLAVLGRLPDEVPLAEALANVAQRIVDRVTSEAPPERAKRLLTDALLLTGLRVKRKLAADIFRGVHVMQESDTYLMIVDEGKEKQAKQAVLLVGEERFGPADETIKNQLDSVSDLERLNRMIRRAVKAADWQEVLDTP